MQFLQKQEEQTIARLGLAIFAVGISSIFVVIDWGISTSRIGYRNPQKEEVTEFKLIHIMASVLAVAMATTFISCWRTLVTKVQ